MTIQPVSFKKGRQSEPRLSKPYEPGRHSERFWSDEEVEVVRRNYPIGGAGSCVALLPGRTASGVYQQAKKLGLYAPRKKDREKIDHPADIDDQLRAAWPLLKGRGAVNALAASLNLPRWWVSKRALKLGLTNPHRKEPKWTEAEKELMTKVPLHDPDRCAQIFREHGFHRTATSIVVKAKRLSLSRRATHQTYSGTEVARILGYDNKSVTQWCVAGEIKAERRNDKRLPQQGGSTWSITPQELRRFIIENIERLDIRKVEKFAFVHVLTQDTKK